MNTILTQLTLRKLANIIIGTVFIFPIAANLTHLQDKIATLKTTYSELQYASSGSDNTEQIADIRYQITKNNNQNLENRIKELELQNTYLISYNTYKETSLPSRAERSDLTNNQTAAADGLAVANGKVLGVSTSSDFITSFRQAISQGIPSDIYDAFKGPQGPSGVTTYVTGPTGYSIGQTLPTATNLGTIGGVTHLGTQEISTNQLTVTQSFTVNQSVPAEFAGNLSIGGNLSLTGNQTTDGDLTVNGNTTLGNANTDTLTLNSQLASNIVPNITNTYDLGSSGLTFKDLYLGGLINGQTISSTANFTGSLSMNGAFINTSSTNSYFTGNVGIGTTTPGTSLDVIGTIRGSNGLTISSGTINLPNGQIDNTELANSSLTITAGAGLINGGAVSLGSTTTLNIGAGTCITSNADDIAVTADCIGDTQLQYNTGQHLTTSSTPTFAGLTLTGSLNYSGVSSDITTSGVEHLALMPGGNVGVGTTSPTATVQIKSGTNNEVQIGATAGTYSTVGVVTDLATLGSVINISRPSDGAFTNSIFSYATTNNNLLNLGIATRHDVVFVAGEAERMRLKYSGNVGIGTSTPTATLHVEGGNFKVRSGLSQMFNTYPGANGNINLRLQDGLGNETVNIATAQMSYFNGGNVGVGTTNPLQNLHIYSAGPATNSTLRIETASLGGYGAILQFKSPQVTTDTVNTWGLGTGLADGTNDFTFYSDASEVLRIKLNGNVGIGTTTPGSKLEVAGDIRIKSGSGGQIIFADGSTMGSSGLGSAAALSSATDAIVTGDSDSNGSGDIILKTGSSDRIHILNTGNVGVGVASPGYYFDIQKAADPVLRQFNTSDFSTANNVSFLQTLNSSTGSRSVFYLTSSFNDTTDATRNSLVQFGTANAGTFATAMSINGGNVGIGTTSPTSLFEVSANTATVIKSKSTGAGSYASVMVQNDAQQYLMQVVGANNNNFQIRDGNAGVNRLVIDTTGNVGIGTTTPGQKLEIYGDAGLLRFNYPTASSYGGVLFSENGSPKGYLLRVGSTFGAPRQGYLELRNDAGISFWPDNANQLMTILTSGNVGIGTTTPSQKLEVSGGAYISGTSYLGGVVYSRTSLSNDGATYLTVGGGTSGHTYFSGNVGIGITAPRGNLNIWSSWSADPSQALSSNTVGNLQIISTDGYGANKGAGIVLGGQYQDAPFYGGFGYIYGLKENGTNTNLDGYLRFDTSQNGAPYHSEKMRITSTGNVGIGTTTPNYNLDVIGTASVSTNAYVAGSLRAGLSVLGYGRSTSGDDSLIVYDSVPYAGNYHDLVMSGGTDGNYAVGMRRVTTVSTPGYQQPRMDLFVQTKDTNAPVDRRVVMTLNGDGNVGINTTVPGGKLEIANGAVLSGTAASTILRLDGGTLGSTAGNEVALASFGAHTASITSLGVRIQRTASTSNWWDTAIGLGVDVDNTVRAGASMWLHAGGNVGIGTTTPAAKFDVVGVGSGTDSIRLTNAQGSYLIAKTTGVSGYSAGLELIGGASGADWLMMTNRGDVTTNADDLTFYKNIAGTGSTGAKFTINSSGNVGIGTTVPLSKLDISDSAGYGGLTVGYTSGITFTDRGTDVFKIYYPSSSGVTWLDSKGFDTGFKSNSSATTMYLTQTGNVGIGISNPTDKLYVNGGVTVNGIMNAGSGSLSSDGNYVYLQSWASKPLKINNEGNNLLLNPGSGNVGIGTTNPLNKFHINGGQFRFSNSDGVSMVYMNHGAATGTTYSEIDALVASGGAWGNLVFQSGGGSVGIGTTAPGTDLQVRGSNYGISLIQSTSDHVYDTLYIGNNGANRIIGSNIKTKTGAWVVPDTAYASSYIDFSGTPGNTYLGDINFNTRAAGDVSIGTTKMTIKNDGNVGIGITNPGVLLHVNGTALASNYRLNLGNTTGIQYGGGDTGQVLLYGGSTLSATFGANWITFAPPVFFPGSGVWNSSGNVGIGTTTPGTKLEVAIGSSYVYVSGAGVNQGAPTGNYDHLITGRIRLGYMNGTNIGTIASNGADSGLSFVTHSSGTGWVENMRIQPNGNVGIGTIAPGVKFETMAPATNGIVTVAHFGQDNTGAGNGAAITLGTRRYDSYYTKIASVNEQGSPSYLNLAMVFYTMNNTYLAGSEVERMRIASNGNITFANYSASNCCSDVAEFYSSSEPVEAADVTAVDVNVSGGVKKARAGDVAIGIVSTNPAIAIQEQHLLVAGGTESFVGNPLKPVVALAGRVPVKFSNENGPVVPGDRVTISKTIPGFAMKMIESGQSLGIVLENSSPDSNKVLVFVNLGYHHVDVTVNADENNIIYDKNIDMSGLSILNVKDIVSISGKWSISEGGVITAKQLCLDEICITKDQLKALLEKNGLLNKPVISPAPEALVVTPEPAPEAPAIEPAPTPVVEPIPEVAPASTESSGEAMPEPVVEPAPVVEPVVTPAPEPTPVVEPTPEVTQ